MSSHPVPSKTHYISSINQSGCKTRDFNPGFLFLSFNFTSDGLFLFSPLLNSLSSRSGKRVYSSVSCHCREGEECGTNPFNPLQKKSDGRTNKLLLVLKFTMVVKFGLCGVRDTGLTSPSDLKNKRSPKGKTSK